MNDQENQRVGDEVQPEIEVSLDEGSAERQTRQASSHGSTGNSG